MPATERPRILTGDQPTGRLHIGHWVGSLENRVRLQDDYDCYFLIANMHAFTTPRRGARGDPARHARDRQGLARGGGRPGALDARPADRDPGDRRADVVPRDAAAVQPRAAQPDADAPSSRPRGSATATASASRSTRSGSARTSSRFAPQLVPVGDDQAAHIEMCREVARRFDHVYCGVDPTTPDADYERAGGVFPIPEAMIGRVGRLVGIDGARKMSKSMDNAIYLSDTTDQIRAKVARAPHRAAGDDRSRRRREPAVPVRARVHRRSGADRRRSRIATRAATTSATASIKAEVAAAIDALLAPMRERRAAYDGPRGDAAILELLRAHTVHANEVANRTVAMARAAMRLDFAK